MYDWILNFIGAPTTNLNNVQTAVVYTALILTTLAVFFVYNFVTRFLEEVFIWWKH